VLAASTTTARAPARNPTDAVPETDIYGASQWQLMRLKFRKHQLALWSGRVIVVLYLMAMFCEFVAPYPLARTDLDHMYAPPQRLHWVHDGELHLWPFVYALEGQRHPETLRPVYAEDRSRPLPIQLFARGEPYHLWGLIPMERHLFGVNGGTVFLLGTDSMGRDLLTRIVYGARISLTVGLIGVALSFVFGLLVGAVSGYYGGWVDNTIQRLIEVLRSFPSIPLWMALSAALPASWSPLQIYFGITVVLSFLG